MAKNVEDLTHRMLRDIRATLDDHGKLLKLNAESMQSLRKDVHEWQETIATASGFAMHANVRNQKLEAEVAKLAKRVEKLEKAK